MDRLEVECERFPDDCDALKRLATFLIMIPGVQVWIEDENEVRVAKIPPVFAAMGSECIAYENGWLSFRKRTIGKFLRNVSHMTIFYPNAEADQVREVLDANLQNLRSVKVSAPQLG